MTLPEGPGWEWNPGQTFVTAFNDAQENRRAQEKAAQEAELASILLPAKRAEAEFNIKKLALDSQLIEKLYKARSAALDGSYRGVTSAIGSSGSVGGSEQEQNPYDIFSDIPESQTQTEQPGEEQPQESEGIDLMGYTTSAADTEKNPVVDLANSIPDQSRPLIDTSKIPTTGMLADASSGLTPTAMSAMRVATDAVSPEEDGSSMSEADQMLLNRLSGKSGGVDFESLPSPQEVARPRISIDSADNEKTVASGKESSLDWRTLDPLLTKRKLLKSQYDGIQGIKNYRLDPIKLVQTSKWNQATAGALEKLSAFGITDPVTLDALTDLPSEQRLKAQRIVQESLSNGGAPNWTSAIQEVTGGQKGDGSSVDRREGLSKTIKEIADSSLDENEKQRMLKPLVDEFNTLTAQQPAYEQFTEADAQLNMLPAYQAKGRPINGRMDYDVLSQELMDTKLLAVQGMLKTNDPRVLNMTRYNTTNDGTKLTESGFAEYQKDLAEKRNKFGNGFVIYTGTDAVFPTKGTEASITPVAASVATPYDEAAKSEASSDKANRIKQIEQEIQRIDEYVANIPDRGIVPFTQGSSWRMTDGGADSPSLPYLGKRTAKQKQEIAQDRLTRKNKLLAELEKLRAEK